MSIHLILGGARSGKSAYAEQLAKASELAVTYVATAQIYDDEFADRVAHHKNRRPKDWQVIQAPFQLAETLRALDHANRDHANQCIIVDCLTLWLAQCICPDCESPENVDWAEERDALLTLLPTLECNVLLVSNEVGMGIVPLGEINRQFQDEQGRLNQAIAQLADYVTFVAAGLPLALKGTR